MSEFHTLAFFGYDPHSLLHEADDLKVKSRLSGLGADVYISDYDVFLSPLSDFKKAMDEAGLSDKVVYLNRNDAYRFKVKGGS